MGDDQENVLARKFAALIEALVRNEVPMTFVNFPRITKDEHYLFEKLGPVFPEVKSKQFHEAFQAVARPELVNQFPHRAERTKRVKELLAPKRRYPLVPA